MSKAFHIENGVWRLTVSKFRRGGGKILAYAGKINLSHALVMHVSDDVMNSQFLKTNRDTGLISIEVV